MIFYFAHDLYARTLKKQFYIITTNFLLRMHLQKSNIAVSINNTIVQKFQNMYNRDCDKFLQV